MNPPDTNTIDPAQRDALILRGIMTANAAKKVAQWEPNAFIETCFTDESGRPIKQAPFHRDIQNAFSLHNETIIYAAPGHGKTAQTAMRLCYEIGRNPKVRILYVSASSSQAEKVLGMVKMNIEHNEALHKIFPHMVRANFPLWSSSTINTSNYAGTRKDYTLQAIGSGGRFLGARIDMAVLDDTVDIDNSSTPARRNKLLSWYESTLITRIEDGGKTWIIGTPWHRADYVHTLEERGVATYRFPIETDGKFIWPEKWNQRRLEERKKQMSGWRLRQQYYMEDSTPEGSAFDLERMRACRGPAKVFGNPADVPTGYQCFTGVDLAIGKSEHSDLTSFCTVASDGQAKQIVDLRAGRFSLMEIKAIAEAQFAKWGGVFIVESNAAQSYLIQLLKGSTRVPVISYTTTQGTKTSEAFGIPAMAIDIENGRWVFPGLPTEPQEIKDLFDEMIAYSPGTHTGDRLMSMYLAWHGVNTIFNRATVRVR